MLYEVETGECLHLMHCIYLTHWWLTYCRWDFQLCLSEFFIENSRQFIPEGEIGKLPKCIQAMVLISGNSLLPEPIITLFPEAYKGKIATIGWKISSRVDGTPLHQHLFFFTFTHFFKHSMRLNNNYCAAFWKNTMISGFVNTWTFDNKNYAGNSYYQNPYEI